LKLVNTHPVIFTLSSPEAGDHESPLLESSSLLLPHPQVVHGHFQRFDPSGH
jgi:hypothetical protein